MSKVIMIQGTMSNAGKSLLCAGLCRVFLQDGYKVAPFKSQNMALNSFITKDGLEMSRSQVMQSEAAKVEPSIYMNPILLKPTNDRASQVIVNGEVFKNMDAREYFAYKTKLIPEIMKAYEMLSCENDIIVVEGAGSPAEINLKENDIVNMGLAKMLKAPVLLAGDIDRGGVFAQLLGTMMLLEEDEKALVKGLIINKFRGDKSILDPGVKMLEEKAKVPVMGVIPYFPHNLEDEDSLSERFDNTSVGLIDIAVIKYPRISNFTDLHSFEQFSEISIRYVDSVKKIGNPDMIVLPGSKNTMGDIKWLRESGLEAMILKLSEKIPVFGICGGYQMLGQEVSDPKGVEEGGNLRGLGLLPVYTELKDKKHRTQVTGTLNSVSGIFSSLSHLPFEGYEIHMGETVGSEDVLVENNDVYGTYIHGIFDKGEIVTAIAKALAKKKGITLGSAIDYKELKDRQYDVLADVIRNNIDMEKLYGIL